MVVKRFIGHYNLIKWIRGDRNSYNASHRTFSYRFLSVVIWLVLIPVHVLDLIGFFLLFDLVRRIIYKTRKLTEFEKGEVKKVFGNSLNWEKTRIRENSWMAKVGAKSAKKNNIGFVLFNTINFSRELNHESRTSDMPWLIHEVVHVLQFKELGAQYIIEALRAQQSAGYGYDGKEGLLKASSLEGFNLEQQADIAKHYYQNLRVDGEVEIYLPFIAEIKRGHF